MTPLLEVRNLSKVYRQPTTLLGRSLSCALHPTSFQLMPGRTLAIMGANGSGKSTLASLIAGVSAPTQGEIFLDGELLEPNNFKQRAQRVRMIFQDADASLNPHLTIGSQLEEPLRFNTELNQAQRIERIMNTLQQVGLLAEHMVFYPHMLSSGQKQRVSIARAIILHPKLLVADEALTSLDSSVRAQITNLLLDLQQALKMSYIFISQQPEIVRHLADEVIVMQDGHIVEYGSVSEVFSKPKHRYTENLLLSESI